MSYSVAELDATFARILDGESSADEIRDFLVRSARLGQARLTSGQEETGQRGVL